MAHYLFLGAAFLLLDVRQALVDYFHHRKRKACGRGRESRQIWHMKYITLHGKY